MRTAVVLVVLAGACAPADRDDATAWQPSWGARSTFLDGMGVDRLVASAHGEVFMLAAGRARRWTASSGGWSEAHQVPGGSAEELAVDAAGGALTIGALRSGLLVTTQFTGGDAWPGGWSPAPVPGAPPNSVRSLPSVSMTDDGSAVISWFERISPPAGLEAVYLAVREGRGAWSAPILLGGSPRFVPHRIAIADLGGELRIAALWAEERIDETAVEGDVLTWKRGEGQGTWQGVVRLLSVSRGAFVGGDLGIDRAGDTTALIAASPGGLALLRHRGTWQAPVVVPVNTDNTGDGALAVDPDGPVLIGWTTCAADTCGLMVLRWTHAGFGPVTTLAAGSRLQSTAALAASGGHGLAAWIEDDSLRVRELSERTWSEAHPLGEAVVREFVEPPRVALRWGAVGAVAWRSMPAGAPATAWASVFAER